MTLNGEIALILRYFTEFIASQVDYVTLVEDRPIMFNVRKISFYLAITDPRSSCTVSLRQLSFLFYYGIVAMAKTILAENDVSAWRRPTS